MSQLRWIPALVVAGAVVISSVPAAQAQDT